MAKRISVTRGLILAAAALLGAAVLTPTGAIARADAAHAERALLIAADAAQFGQKMGVISGSADEAALLTALADTPDIADVRPLARGDLATVDAAFAAGRIDSFYAGVERVAALAEASDGRYEVFTPPSEAPAPDQSDAMELALGEPRDAPLTATR